MKKNNTSPVNEMAVYFSSKYMGEIPTSIMKDVSRQFSRYEVIHSSDGSVAIKVPAEELEIINQFTNDLIGLIEQIQTKNDVLGKKLALSFGITKLIRRTS